VRPFFEAKVRGNKDEALSHLASTSRDCDIEFWRSELWASDEAAVRNDQRAQRSQAWDQTQRRVLHFDRLGSSPKQQMMSFTKERVASFGILGQPIVI
jgi:hypothetical protein